MYKKLTVAVVLTLLVSLPASFAWGQVLAPDFLPPGPNIAFQKPYTYDPPPNYVDCSYDTDRTLLTDGVYTAGYFWVQKTTVGWVRRRPVAITIDLGQVQPIAGVSYNTAAGVASVYWPTNILILVSDDGQTWHNAGDLIDLSNQRFAPPPQPYRVHRFATGELQTHGRYVSLVVDCLPYMVVDEVEVYRGADEWLDQPLPGKPTTLSPVEYSREVQTLTNLKSRLRTDLREISQNLTKVRLNATTRANLLARSKTLETEIEEVDSAEGITTTVLPLNELHERVYALQAPVLRARGFTDLTVWPGYRYDMLFPLQSPARPPAAAPVLSTAMMRNERRAEVLNLTNATDRPLRVTIQVTGLPEGNNLINPREVLFTDTLSRIPVAAAILPSPRDPGRLRLTVPAGLTRQVWLDLNSQGLAAGRYQGTLKITATGGVKESNVPLAVRVIEAVMPDEFDLAIGGWDETNNQGGYEVTAENMMPLIKNLRDHGVNMPWSNPGVIPTPGTYDEAGNMLTGPDFTAWDQWVERWQGVPYWGLFPSVRESFAGEPMGTERFNKMVGAWATAWAEHAARQGIRPEQIMLLLVDEPSTEKQNSIIIAWARAIKATQPKMVIWNDPMHADPTKVDPEFYALSDVLCPNAITFVNADETYRDEFVQQQQAGNELWFYSCSGPTKLLDPNAYYRAQFWLNFKYGGKGSQFWAFADEAGDSWNAYRQSRNQYSPLFISSTEVTDGKHMEAIREGAEDFQLLHMLAAEVARVEGKGVTQRALGEAKELLVQGPQQMMDQMGGKTMRWEEPKNRELPDLLRLQALDLLETLSRL